MQVMDLIQKAVINSFKGVQIFYSWFSGQLKFCTGHFRHESEALPDGLEKFFFFSKECSGNFKPVYVFTS
jgi:hypothetical protein